MITKSPTGTVLIAALVICESSCATVKDEVVYRGNYYWGHEVETFHPCGSKKAFLVTGSNAVLQPLRNEIKKQAAAAGRPYQPIYIEIVAAAEAAPKDGFAADYDGMYRITSVKKSSAIAPSNCKLNWKACVNRQKHRPRCKRSRWTRSRPN